MWDKIRRMNQFTSFRCVSRAGLWCCLLAAGVLALPDSVRGADAPATQRAREGPPRVLVIGDEISSSSSGYLSPLSTALSGQALVLHISGLAGSSKDAPGQIEDWLGEEPWDLVLFNFGLRDFKDKEGTELTAQDLKDYQANLKKIVRQLKRSGAKLVWANTTPVPVTNRYKCKPEDVKRYNEAAFLVMEGAKVPIADLNGAIQGHLAQCQTGDVLFKAEGNKVLAAAAASAIRKALGLPEPPPAAHKGK